MPAVRIFVLPRFLDPLEDLEEGLKFDLTIRQIYIFESALVSFTSTFKLKKTKMNKQKAMAKLTKN